MLFTLSSICSQSQVQDLSNFLKLSKLPWEDLALTFTDQGWSYVEPSQEKNGNYTEMPPGLPVCFTWARP